MRFAHPEAYWLLLLLPLLWGLSRVASARQVRFLHSLGEPGLRQFTPSRFPRFQRRSIRLVLATLPFLGAILALTDPRLPGTASQLRHGALDVVLVIDVSKSMAAEDCGRQSRLARARQIARQLLSPLRGNRVGLVTFAGTSFVQAELSEDLVALDFILRHWVMIDAVRVGGSDVAQALVTGVKLFSRDPERERIILLFSDGGTGNSSMTLALQQAKRRGIRIITLGLGGLVPARIPRYDAQGKFVGYVQKDGHTATTRLQEAPLRRIAAATGGIYMRVTLGEAWRTLFTRPQVAGAALQPVERKIFQPFLLLGLLGLGASTLIARL